MSTRIGNRFNIGTDHVLLNEDTSFDYDTFFDLTRFSEAYLTDQECAELPKVWIVGGDGAMGDIGFQNLSKV